MTTIHRSRESLTLWSHDRTSSAGSPPANSIDLPVANGLYSVRLGDPTFAGVSAELPSSMFADHLDVRLRVWFDDGTHGLQQRTPDSRIASVGYPLAADRLTGMICERNILPGTIGAPSLADAGVTTANLQPGAVVTATHRSHPERVGRAENATERARDQPNVSTGTIRGIHAPSCRFEYCFQIHSIRQNNHGTMHSEPNRIDRNLTALVGLILVTSTLASRASFEVSAGSSLYETDPTLTSFFGIPFQGVPLGTFDFGGSIGVQTVGPTDTIVRRLTDATVGGPGMSLTVPTAVDAFQLRSAVPASILGGPLGIYYLTLQSARGGPLSTGSLTLNFGPEGDPHGTFSSSFSLFVDVRLGSLAGPILDSRAITIADSGSTPWGHLPSGNIQIQGVNLNLDGVGPEQDFWPQGTIIKTTPNGSLGASAAGHVPDGGSTLVTLGVAGVFLGGLRRWKSRA